MNITNKEACYIFQFRDLENFDLDLYIKRVNFYYIEKNKLSNWVKILKKINRGEL